VRLTKRQLQVIIKEELARAMLNEQSLAKPAHHEQYAKIRRSQHNPDQAKAIMRKWLGDQRVSFKTATQIANEVDYHYNQPQGR